MWHVELMDGKDTPAGALPKKYSDLGKTPGLMCKMMENIKCTGKACTIDSGSYVSKGIVELAAGSFIASIDQKAWAVLARGCPWGCN